MKNLLKEIIVISPGGGSTKAALSIAYAKHKNIFIKFICFFFVRLNANWCLINMLWDSMITLEANQNIK